MVTSPARKKPNPLRNAARLRTIVGVLARHGFQNLAERAKLGRFLLEKFSSSEVEKLSAPVRLRMAFEQLGPTFVKLGQLLATRPDLIPADFSEEFKKLHDQVTPVPFGQMEQVLNSHFGTDWRKVFAAFDTAPLAAASIAQVYRARLNDGGQVVVKVQRPGVSTIIEEDLSVLYTLADLLQRYVPEARIYNPQGIVDEFFKTMELETNFIVEANNIRRFARNFADEPKIVIPRVYAELSGKRVLVMEALDGIPLSHKNALEQEGIDREEVLKTGLRSYLKMVFTDGLFHGDLHAGNMFVMPDNRVGLIDFGVVGRLNRKTQGAIANMLLALAAEDYDRLAYEYVDLAPYTGHVDVDRFARELRDLIAPYYGLTLRHMNVGRLLLDSTGIAARHGLTLPSELVMFFKSIVVIEGMGRIIVKDFDFLAHSLEFATELVQKRYERDRVVRDLAVIARDLNSLLAAFPQQFKQFLRRLNSPQFSMNLRLEQTEDVRRTVESSARLIFWGLVVGALIIGSFLGLDHARGPRFLDLPVLSALGFASAIFLTLLALFR